MSKTVHKYNVYDNGELILKNLTPNEIRVVIGENVQNVTNYANSGHKFKGRYTFEFAEDITSKSEYELAFEKEWNDAIKPFKRVIWVKEGGRKLVVGGKENV